MQEQKFSNGLTVRAFVGDGFDGGSGLYFTVERPHVLTYAHISGLSASELVELAQIVKWYIEKESQLRYREGRSSTNEYCAREVHNVYNSLFLLGQLHLLLNKDALQYTSGRRYWPRKETKDVSNK